MSPALLGASTRAAACPHAPLQEVHQLFERERKPTIAEAMSACTGLPIGAMPSRAGRKGAPEDGLCCGGCSPSQKVAAPLAKVRGERMERACAAPRSGGFRALARSATRHLTCHPLIERSERSERSEFGVRPAWARSSGCKSPAELATARQVKCNCARVTERGKEAWSVSHESRDTNRIRGDAGQGEQAPLCEALVAKGQAA